ncbi:peroxiredoxin [Bradyrhizobium sp. TZ2]
MSKKTRKKSSNAPARKSRGTSAGKPPAAKAARSAKASAKKPAAKASKAVAKKAGKGADKKPAKTAKTAPAKASHKPTSKQLKSSPSAPSKAIPAPAPAAAPETGFAEGALAPAFRLPRDGGDSISLADYAGQKLVLFFYPRADTPGCTREAIDFTRLSGAFADAGAAVLGISADSVKAQESFRNKHQLSVPLISDEKHEMLEAYGAWGEKSMYGRSFMGIIRTTVLIGADGRIARIWRNVRVDGHADEVLAAVREM